MIKVRRKEETFLMKGGWFTGYWHFSFDRYYDPENTSFGTLRVFNVDTLIPGAVWPMHPHRDMEVITYCVEGQFEHADDLGNGGVLEPGDVQQTTVGKGMWHSEINHSKTEPMTFVQIWIRPRLMGLPSSVEQKRVRPEERLNRLLPLVSNRYPGALPIQQDAEFYASTLQAGFRLSHSFEPGYGGYLYVVSGVLNLNGQALSAGDAAKIVGEPKVDLDASVETHLLLVVVKA